MIIECDNTYLLLYYGSNMSTVFDYIEAGGAIATAMAVGIAAAEYWRSKKENHAQLEHEMAVQLRTNLNEVVRITGDVVEIMREGTPLIMASASIARTFRQRLGDQATATMFLDKLRQIPVEENHDPFVLLAVVDGWTSSIHTQQLAEIINRLNDLSSPLHEINAIRTLPFIIELLNDIAHDSYSPVPLFTRLLSKEPLAIFIEENKNESDITQLENKLSFFLFGNSSMYFALRYSKSITYLRDFVQQLSNIVSKWDDSKITKMSKKPIVKINTSTKTGDMKEMIKELDVSQDEKNTLHDLINNIEKSIAKPKL